MHSGEEFGRKRKATRERKKAWSEKECGLKRNATCERKKA
jgi:hypothetical protein